MHLDHSVSHIRSHMGKPPCHIVFQCTRHFATTIQLGRLPTKTLPEGQVRAARWCAASGEDRRRLSLLSFSLSAVPRCVAGLLHVQSIEINCEVRICEL